MHGHCKACTCLQYNTPCMQIARHALHCISIAYVCGQDINLAVRIHPHWPSLHACPVQGMHSTAYSLLLSKDTGATHCCVICVASVCAALLQLWHQQHADVRMLTAAARSLSVFGSRARSRARCIDSCTSFKGLVGETCISCLCTSGQALLFGALTT